MKKNIKKRRIKQGFELATICMGILIFCAVTFIAGTYFSRYTEAKVKEETAASERTSILQSQNYTPVEEENEEYGDYSEISQKLSVLESTETEWTDVEDNTKHTGLYFIATEEHGNRMVYNITQDNLCDKGYKLSDFNYIWVDSVNSAFYCVINIPGETVDFSDYYILVRDSSGNLASRLVINCYEAKKVILDNTILTGTLLAPYAAVEYNETTIYGDVLAKAFSGNRKYYKEITFGGYSELLTVPTQVTFSNPALRTLLLDWLRTNVPERYASYSDEYILTNVDLAYVTELDLSGSVIADLHDDLWYLVNLETLSLKNTKLLSVDVSGLKKLKSLDVSNSDIYTIIFAEDNNIESINISGSKIIAFNVLDVPNVKSINAAGKPIMSLTNLKQLTKLEELDVSYSTIVSVAGAFPTTIKKLNISANTNLKYADFTEYTNLESITMRDCNPESVKFDGMEKLKELDISYNGFTELDLSGAKSLTKVSAFSDVLTTITVYAKNTTVLKLKNTTVKTVE